MSRAASPSTAAHCRATGPPWVSTDPATGEIVWHGRLDDPAGVDAAVEAAAAAFPGWSRRPLAERTAFLHAFRQQLLDRREEMARLISREMGKPCWESLAEVDAMAAKIDLSVQALGARCPPLAGGSGTQRWQTRYRPHGVLGVLGPFNFPGHLPNGHIVPALLAGNTVVFKPSEKTPGVGEQYVRLWDAAGLPPGVLNLVQGEGDIGQDLATHPGLAGLLFTGSYRTGAALHRLFAGQPEKLLVLEMGGNNPLAVDEVDDLDAAVAITLVSAFITSGQRCTCARRLLLVDSPRAEDFLDRLLRAAAGVRIGPWDADPQPFMGPLVDPLAAEALLTAQAGLVRAGARLLLPSRHIPGHPLAFLTPGIVDVTGASVPDDECFGPLLQVVRCPDIETAIGFANDTAYGLAAAILTDRPDRYQHFIEGVRAGVVNWNLPTTGARSAAPFGGLGRSGNHRPSAWFAADYAASPVATMEAPTLSLPSPLPPGLPAPGGSPDSHP